MDGVPRETMSLAFPAARSLVHVVAVRVWEQKFWVHGAVALVLLPAWLPSLPPPLPLLL
jgi:hypothetical protein